MGARPQGARQGLIPRGCPVNPDSRAMLQLFDFEHALIRKPHILFGSPHRPCGLMDRVFRRGEEDTAARSDDRARLLTTPAAEKTSKPKAGNRLRSRKGRKPL